MLSGKSYKILTPALEGLAGRGSMRLRITEDNQSLAEAQSFALGQAGYAVD